MAYFLRRCKEGLAGLRALQGRGWSPHGCLAGPTQASRSQVTSWLQQEGCVAENPPPLHPCSAGESAGRGESGGQRGKYSQQVVGCL